jgi:hypothetical protein
MSVIGPTTPTDTGPADPGDVSNVADELGALTPAASGGSAGASAVAKLEGTLLKRGTIDAKGAQALVKAAADSGGVTDAERKQFVSLLRQHGRAITPAALDVLASHFGVAVRRPAPPVFADTTGESAGDLTLTSDQSDGMLHGTAKPGDVIEAINLSTAPDRRLHLEDTTQVATAGPDGTFAGAIPDMAEGDVVRMRARSADGTAGPWLTIHASGLPPRDRNAELNVDRTNLTANADGSVGITQITDRPITEPGAQVRFVNMRTGKNFDMTASADGGVPDGFKLQGSPGDQFQVAVSDGVHNTDFSTIAGTLTAGGGTTTTGPEPDLGPGDTGYTMAPFHGPLFDADGGPDPLDVRQGALGDCYLPATFAAIAEARPDVIRNMVKDNGDGTYTVRFYQNGDKNSPVDVNVDNKLYVRSSGTPLYGEAADTPDTPSQMEMWYPIVEKAYAEWKGGYSVIGNGGEPGVLLSEVLGARGPDTYLPAADADSVFTQIKAAVGAKKPAAAVTFGDDRKDLYTDTGVYADHTYSIIGTKEQNGQRYVTLRNPWGESVPTGEGDGRDDGVFDIPLADFMKLYESFSIAAS